MGLTKKAIDAARYRGKGAHYLWDDELAGFGVRIYPSGRKAFVVTYRVKVFQTIQSLLGEEDPAKVLAMLGKAQQGESVEALETAVGKVLTALEAAVAHPRAVRRVHRPRGPDPGHGGACTSQAR